MFLALGVVRSLERHVVPKLIEFADFEGMLTKGIVSAGELVINRERVSRRC